MTVLLMHLWQIFQGTARHRVTGFNMPCLRQEHTGTSQEAAIRTRGEQRTMKLLCYFLGHKWKWRGRCEMNDEPSSYNEGYLVYECVRCGIACKENEDGKRETWR